MIFQFLFSSQISASDICCFIKNSSFTIQHYSALIHIHTDCSSLEAFWIVHTSFRVVRVILYEVQDWARVLQHLFWKVHFYNSLGPPCGSEGKEFDAMWETWVPSLRWEDPLEKGMAAHSSTLAWRIPSKGEPGGLQSTGSRRVKYDWAIKHTHIIALELKRSYFFFSVHIILLPHIDLVVN